MARVTITISDDPTTGKPAMVSDPPAMTLLERRARHGSDSLSNAEGLAVILFAHVLEHGTTNVQAPSGLILPPEYQ